MQWQDDLLADELFAQLHGFAGSSGSRPHREMLFRGEVEVDRREIGEEGDDGSGSLQGRADHLERSFSCVLDDLQEPAAREFVAVVETERVGLHVRLRNSTLRP